MRSEAMSVALGRGCARARVKRSDQQPRDDQRDADQDRGGDEFA